MADLTLTTFDWVPAYPRGYVRDLRIRWALEEAGLPYRVESEPFRDRSAEHLAHQPFGQVPWLTDTRGRSEVTQCLFAALNSVEAASLLGSIWTFSGEARDTMARSCA